MILIDNNSLKEVVSYLCKYNNEINFDNYKFVLTDEEIYVLTKLIDKIRNSNNSITWQNIAHALYNKERLVKCEVNEDIVKKIAVIAYKKMLHVDRVYGNDRNIKLENQTLCEALQYPSSNPKFNESITLSTYNKFCLEGALFTSTSRFQRFVLKYRLGMLHDYQKLSFKEAFPGFYDDVIEMCQSLGYTNRQFTHEQIDNVIAYVNSQLLWVEEVLNKENAMNEVDKITYDVENILKDINEKLYEQEEIENIDEKLALVNRKLKIGNEIIDFYRQKYDNDNPKKIG